MAFFLFFFFSWVRISFWKKGVFCCKIVVFWRKEICQKMSSFGWGSSHIYSWLQYVAKLKKDQDWLPIHTTSWDCTCHWGKSRNLWKNHWFQLLYCEQLFQARNPLLFWTFLLTLIGCANNVAIPLPTVSKNEEGWSKAGNSLWCAGHNVVISPSHQVPILVH